MRLGLFNHIFLRVIGLIIFVVAAMLLFNHMHEQRAILQAWENDLQQEAEWIGRHWAPQQDPIIFAESWHATHDGVRLRIYDGARQLIADSQEPVPENPEPFSLERSALLGHAPLELADGPGGIVLSRSGLPILASSARVGLFITALLLVAIAALVMFPLIRGVTNALARLSGLASRVAAGQFGETIPEKGNRDIVALIASFNEMSVRLKQAEQQNERLLSDVSHELRSPLARLTALIDTIQRHPDETQELSAQIKNEVSLMGRLIDDVLEISKFETPEVHLDKQTVQMDDWFASAAAQFKSRAQNVGISFTWDSNLPSAQVQLDSHRMMQVLGNVIDNAIKAVADRAGPLVELKVTVSEHYWILQVIDNGRGMPEADIPYVFDRFYRVEVARTRQTQDNGGAGLGLSISRAIVMAHEGEMSLTSTLGKGTVVEIQLPLVLVAPVASSQEI